MRAQLRHVGLRLLGRAHVGLRDDLHQRDAGAVEIDVGIIRVLVVDRLAGVLLQMQALDADLHRLAVDVDLDLALADDRAACTGDLIALRQIGIEVVLAVEDALQVDLRLEAEAGAHRLRDAFRVDHRQHAGHRRVDQRDVAVGLGAECRRSAGEQLGVRGDLGMHLQADDDFPLAGRARDQVRRFGFHRDLLRTHLSSPVIVSSLGKELCNASNRPISTSANSRHRHRQSPRRANVIKYSRKRHGQASARPKASAA